LKVVYHCFGGAHASPTAAAIHLKIIDSHRIPAWSDFKKIPYFDQITNLDHGQLIKIGDDHLGNEVFILARRNSAPVALNLIREVTRMTGGDPAQYHFVDCVQLHNLFMVTGGFSSRGLGFVRFGRPLVIFGTRLSFKVLASIVQKTIEYLESRETG
jgi:hypothetical protein